LQRSSDVGEGSGVQTSSHSLAKRSLTECSIIIESDNEDDNNDDQKHVISAKNETIGDQMIDIEVGDIREQFLKTISRSESQSEPKFSAQIKSSENEMAERELIHELQKTSFREMETIGQFNRGFIVTKLGTDLFVVDQHASDERFNYERLLSTTAVEIQNLVVPLPLELSAANEQVIIDNMYLFKKLGFGIVLNDTAPAGHRLHLSSLPISKDWTAGKEDIEEIVGVIIETPIELLNDYKLNGFKKVIASRACRSSVMIGEPLIASQMKTIVDHMSGLENPWHCAHNRPTIRHLVNLTDISSLSNKS